LLALLAALLNSRQPVLEGVDVAWKSALAFQSCHFRSFPRGQIHFPNLFGYGKVVAK
jgi:hypothetical protein